MNEQMPDDDDLLFYIPFNIIEVISRQWKADNEWLYAMKRSHELNLASSRIWTRHLMIWSREH